MKNTKIYPVLLCGGSGTRLWPLSRKSFPKQFVSFIESDTLFQASVKRLSGSLFTDPIAITCDAYRFIVTEQLKEAGCSDATVLIEPEGRNTAPAILAAALWLEKTEPNALMLVAPSDHVISDDAKFHECIKLGASVALDGEIITFGIKPNRAETGYGWLKAPNSSVGKVIKLDEFVEKPTKDVAEQMLADEQYFWNAGIFLFSVSVIIKAFELHAPGMLEPVRQSVLNASSDLSFHRLDSTYWKQAEDISIDYAIMEKASNISVVPYASDWSDLGDWNSVWRDSDKDDNGVSTTENATAINCENTLLRAEASSQQVVGVGLKDIVVVSMPDAVLVADKNQSQEVKRVVSTLRDKGVKQSDAFPKDHRPWGWFETLTLSDRFQVKRIVVKPGGILSLQSHFHRSEHWIVVSGTAKVTIGDKVQLITENQSVYIPLGEVHRMENPGKLPMTLIEVQTGAYLGEDDIVRYEDLYARE